MRRRARRSLGLIGVAAIPALLLGCGRHQRTVTVAVPGSPDPGAALGTGTGTAGGGSSPVTTGAGGSGGGSIGALDLSLTGPGPERVAADVTDLTALAFRLESRASVALEVERFAVQAQGRLDDAAGVATLRLAEDTDGDGAFDRNVDRVLASGGFLQDDGTAELTPPGLTVAAGGAFRGLVVCDLAGTGRTNDDLRLVVAPGAVRARSLAGNAAPVRHDLLAGPVLRLGGWVEPHEAFAVPSEGLRPQAVRDARGRTHVALFQNHNFNSDVLYTLFDGRSFSPVDGVSRSPNTAWNQHVGVDAAGLPVVVWEEWDGGPGDVGVRFSRFDPGAFAWTPSARTSTGSGVRNLNPRVLVAPTQPSVVHVVWEHFAGGARGRLHYRRLDAGGWSAVAEVSSASSAQAEARAPSLALLPSGELLLAWAENEPARSEVRIRTLGAGGFSPPAVVARGASPVDRTELLADGSAVHLAFEEGGEVWHTRRDAGGAWSAAANVSRTAGFSELPSLALHQGALHVAWIEDATHVLTARRRGGAFGTPEAITRGAFFRQTVALVSEGDRLRALWQDRSLGRQRVFTSWRDDGPFEAPAPVAAPGGDPGRPAPALSPGGAVHVAWSLDAGGNAEVFHARRADPGAGFGAAENVSQSAGGSYQPSLAPVGSGVVCAWEEDDPTAGFQVRAAFRDASGWSTPAVVSSASPAYAPAVAGGRRPVVVWTAEAAPGDFDLRLAEHDGRAWSAPRPLAPRAGSSAWKPHAARGPGGTLAVAWEEEAAAREVLVATVAPSGTSVAAVASSASGQHAPRVAWDGGDLHVVWVEDGRVRTAVRPAGAAAFDPPVDLSARGSWTPDVAVAGGLVTVTWEQWSGSDARVLQRVRALQGGAVTWTPAEPLDLARGPSKGVAAAGDPVAGTHVFWTDPGRVVHRERRAR